MSTDGTAGAHASAAAAPAPRVTVVLATYNRGQSLARLLRQLAAQTLPPDRFEVVAVDDGSTPPAREALAGLALPYRFQLIEQANGGPAVARHRGATEARGEILVITDDDMQVPPEFLEKHLALHEPGTRRVVLGRMRPSDAPDLPLFERYHMARFNEYSAEPEKPRGTDLCTGNVSMRRADYLAVGGFDLRFRLAEDIDLGLRLEKAGVEFRSSLEAYSIHETDHREFSFWRRRCFQYGRQEMTMARKYPDVIHADPFRHFFENSAAKLPFVNAVLLVPGAGRALSGLVCGAAVLADRLKLERLAIQGVSLLYALEYFDGVRAGAGGTAAAYRACAGFVEKAQRAGRPVAGVGKGAAAFARFLRAVLGPDRA